MHTGAARPVAHPMLLLLQFAMEHAGSYSVIVSVMVYHTVLLELPQAQEAQYDEAAETMFYHDVLTELAQSQAAQYDQHMAHIASLFFSYCAA